jgi:hypothetical protein
LTRYPALKEKFTVFKSTDSFKKLSCGWRSTSHLLKNQDIKPIKNLVLNMHVIKYFILKIFTSKTIDYEAVLSDDTLDTFFDGFFKSNIHLSLPNSGERFLVHRL